MKTVLIIDDTAEARLLVGKVLEKHGYAVVEAGDGEAGIESARVRKPDLILVDLHMPKLDGFATTRQLKADPDTTGIPVIALSAETSSPNRDAIYEAGCQGFINKPVDYDLLIERVAGAIG